MASGYDISASASDATTQGQSFGAFTVGGNSGTKWLPLALVALGALALFFWSKRKS